MAVRLIGNRIVKEIGSGDAVKKIITETLNGKTYTKVLDKDGNVVVNRVKQISSQSVGDKQVKTIQKVKMVNNELTRDTFDRVYKDGELVGRRATKEIHDGDKFVKLTSVKQSANDIYPIAKKFNKRNGRVREKVACPSEDGMEDLNEIFAKGYNGNWRTAASHIRYNDKGLPVSRLLWSEGCTNYYDGKTLSALRNLHYDTFPDKPYADACLKLRHLDARQYGDNALNNLDKYIS